MTLTPEIPVVTKEPDCPVYLHDPLAPGRHRYAFGTGLTINVRHRLTNQVLSMPTVVLVCACGKIRHVQVGDPESTEAVQ